MDRENCERQYYQKKRFKVIKELSTYIHETKLYVTCCFKCLFQEFVKDPINENYSTISYKTFLRNLPPNIILPSKKTDLCELCWNAKKIEKKTSQI